MAVPDYKLDNRSYTTSHLPRLDMTPRLPLSQAPEAFKGSIMAIYFFFMAFGNVLSAVMYGPLSSVLSPFALLLLYATLMSVTGAVFILAAFNYVAGARHRGAPESTRGGA
jgi:hypothetical protein